MSVILKKDTWKIKDPNTGEYRDSTVFAATLTEDMNAAIDAQETRAAGIISDTSAGLTAQETRAAGIISDASEGLTSQQTRAAGIVSDAQADIDTIAASVQSMTQTGTDTTLTISGAAADAAVVGSEVEQIKSSLEHYKEYIHVIGNVAVFDDNVGEQPLSELKVSIDSVQAGSGDPSPDNVRAITGWSSSIINHHSYYETCVPVTPYNFGDVIGTSNGITLTYIGYGKYNAKGTTTATCNIYWDIYPIVPQSTSVDGRKIRLNNTSASSKARVVFYGNGANLDNWVLSPSNRTAGYSALSDKTITKLCLNVDSGTTIDVNFKIEFTNDSQETYNVSFPNEAGTVYGGILDALRGTLTVTKKYLHVDGTNVGVSTYYGSDEATRLPSINISAATAVNAYTEVTSSYLKSVSVASSQNSIGIGNAGSHIILHIGDIQGVDGSNGYSSNEELYAAANTYLSEHPLDLYYTLVTPIVYSVAPIQINTLLGTNKIWANTGPIKEAVYSKEFNIDDLKRSIESNISGVEELMTATKSYAVGNLVIANHVLYKITAPIVTGEDIIAETNCIETTIENERSIINEEITNLKTKTNIEDYFINENRCYIDYDYDRAVHAVATPGSYNDYRAFSVDRCGQIIEITNDHAISSFMTIRMSGGTERAGSDATLKSWAGVINTQQGHTYRVYTRKLSGSIIRNDEETSLSCSIYLEGTAATAGTAELLDDNTYIRTFTSGGGSYNIAVYIAAGTVCTNAKLLVWMEDLTLTAEKQNKKDLKQFVDTMHPFVDYNYIGRFNYRAKSDSASDSTMLGYERSGMFITLNGKRTRNIWLRMNGETKTTVEAATVRAWNEDMVVFESGWRYKATLYKLTHPEVPFDHGSIACSLYKAGEAANAKNASFGRYKDRLENIIIGDGNSYNVVIYLTANETSFDHEKFLLTIEKMEEVHIESYYLEEMADTIRKVHDFTTAPSLVFMVATDIHRYSSNAAGYQTFDEMIRNMTYFSKHVKCDFLLNMGDLTDGDQIQEITTARAYDCTEKFLSIGVPYFFAMGNHDTNYYSNPSTAPYKFTMDEVFRAYYSAIKNVKYNRNTHGTDFYVDYDELDIRVICLNANNADYGYRYIYSPATAEWLSTVLQTSKKVIVSMHQSTITSQVYDGTSSTNSTGVTIALRNFVNNGGTLIQLNGHSHFDAAFIDPWLCVSHECARYSNRAEDNTSNPGNISGFIDEVVFNARIVNESSEDCWSACVYKPDSNEFAIIRFGAGKDKYFHVTPIAPSTVTTKLSGTITWSSSNTSVATVSDGVITGASTGKCAVLAKDEIGNYECWIVENS